MYVFIISRQPSGNWFDISERIHLMDFYFRTFSPRSNVVRWGYYFHWDSIRLRFTNSWPLVFSFCRFWFPMITTLVITLGLISVFSVLVNLTLSIKIFKRPNLHSIFNVGAALQFLVIGITVPLTCYQYYQVWLQELC